MTRHDDDFGEGEQWDDGEAFANTLYHIGTTQVDQLLRHCAEHCPGLADRDFFPLIEVVLQPYKEFLSPEQFEEMWGMVYVFVCEMRRDSDPNVTYEQCEEQVKQHLLGPRNEAPDPKKPRSTKKKRRK